MRAHHPRLPAAGRNLTRPPAQPDGAVKHPQTRCKTAQSDPRAPATTEAVLDRDGRRSYASDRLTVTHGTCRGARLALLLLPWVTASRV